VATSASRPVQLISTGLITAPSVAMARLFTKRRLKWILQLTSTYQKFLLCISSQGQDLYSNQKLDMYIYWFSSESGYRRQCRLQMPTTMPDTTVQPLGQHIANQCRPLASHYELTSYLHCLHHMAHYGRTCCRPQNHSTQCIVTTSMVNQAMATCNMHKNLVKLDMWFSKNAPKQKNRHTENRHHWSN